MSRNSSKFISRIKVQQTIDPSDPQAISKIIDAINDINRELDNLRKYAEDNPLIFGNGTPQNNVAAKLGMLYVSLDGGTSTTLYVKESNDKDKNGWVAK